MQAIKFGFWPMAAGLSLMATVVVAPLSAHAEGIGTFFAGSAETSTKVIDHSNWNKLLAINVVASPDGVNRIAYKRLGGMGRAQVAVYVMSLEAVDPRTLSRSEQLAYWINLYNAVSLRAVIAKYPVKSIKEVNLPDADGKPAEGPWSAKLVKVAGQSLSLNDIENGVVRPVFKDPRAHYALNCLSVGCPNMRAGAYTGSGLEAQLEQAARDFINHPRAVSFKDGKVIGSSVYDWFLDDFGGMAGLKAHLVKYAGNDLKPKLAGLVGFDSFEYDWALADATP